MTPMKHIEPLMEAIRKPVCGLCAGKGWIYALSTEDIQVNCPRCSKSHPAAHGPWCGRCGKPMTPPNSTVAPELFLCDHCAAQDGIKPAAQERPLTALGEACEYHTRRASGCQQSADYHLAKGDHKFADAYLASAAFHTRLATACREADEQ